MKISVAVAVVLCLSGWFAKPYAQDWWLTGQACDGVLPADAVPQLKPEDAHLTDAEAQQVAGLGSYRCEVTMEDDDGDDHRFLEATAYTRRDDQDLEFEDVFPMTGFAPIAPLPGKLPGFVDTLGVVRLLLPCPDLEPDAAGRERSMLVSTDLGFYTDHAPPHAAYEVAVAFADSASEKLGCGAEPLDVPDGGGGPASLAETDDLDTVSLSQVKGTACGWLATAGLPDSTQWRAVVRANDSAPVSRCEVTTGGYGEEHKLVFAGWYGDWSNRLGAFHGEPGTLRAAARCGGQAANYKLRTSEESGLDADQKQQLFEAFLHNETRRHDCSNLHFTE